jgi:hypothetical protein
MANSFKNPHIIIYSSEHHHQMLSRFFFNNDDGDVFLTDYDRIGETETIVHT